MINKKIQNDRAFTIIETLVAISILMISIAGPLTIAHKGLLSAVYAHDQLIASYLAQDAMEYIKNIRDSNIMNRPNDPWLDKLSQCTESDHCSVDTISNPNGGNAISAGINHCSNCILSIKNFSYLPATGGRAIPTKFYRYFYLQRNVVNVNNEDDEYKAIVKVTWNNGTVSQEVTYESQLFNIIK